MTDQLAHLPDADPTPPAPAPPFDLRRHLIATGHLDNHGIGRTARATICRHCHQPTISGLDADTCAIDTTVDPTPINPIGETLAILTGRRTYDLTRHHNRYQLDPREPAHINQPRRHPVLADHRCHTPALPSDPTPLPAARHGDQPPF